MNIKYLKIEFIPGRSVTFAKPPTAKSILGLFRKYNCTEVELELFNSLIVPGRPELDNLRRGDREAPLQILHLKT